MTNVPARLDIFTGLPERDNVTSWPIITSTVVAGSSPKQAAMAFSRALSSGRFSLRTVKPAAAACPPWRTSRSAHWSRASVMWNSGIDRHDPRVSRLPCAATTAGL